MLVLTSYCWIQSSGLPNSTHTVSSKASTRGPAFVPRHNWSRTLALPADVTAYLSGQLGVLSLSLPMGFGGWSLRPRGPLKGLHGFPEDVFLAFDQVDYRGLHGDTLKT